MNIQSELLYTDKERIIVKVSGWEGNKNLGSALAEGITVEIAEDNAIMRLEKRLSNKGQIDSISNLPNNEITENKDQFSTTNISKLPNSESGSKKELDSVILPISIPEDWTNELYEYEKEIKRLGFDKENENILINLILGYSNRNMITDYNDLVTITKILKYISKEETVEEIKSSLVRENLINKNNKILKELKWDTNIARDYLYKNFNSNSRSELSNKNLIIFNIMLEEIIKN